MQVVFVSLVCFTLVYAFRLFIIKNIMEISRRYLSYISYSKIKQRTGSPTSSTIIIAKAGSKWDTCFVVFCTIEIPLLQLEQLLRYCDFPARSLKHDDHLFRCATWKTPACTCCHSKVVNVFSEERKPKNR